MIKPPTAISVWSRWYGAGKAPRRLEFIPLARALPSHILLSAAWHFCQLRTGGHRCWRQVRPHFFFFSPFHFQRLWKKKWNKPGLGSRGGGRIGEGRWWCSLWGSRSLWVKVGEIRHTDFSLAAGTLERAKSCNPSPNLTPRSGDTKLPDLTFRSCHFLIRQGN